MLLGGNSYAFAFPRFFTDEWGKMGGNENISVIFFYILQKKINFAENSLLRPVALEEGCLANGVGNSLGRGRYNYCLYVNIIANLLTLN